MSSLIERNRCQIHDDRKENFVRSFQNKSSFIKT